MKEQISITMGMDIASLRKSLEAARKLVQQTVAVMKTAFFALAGAVGVSMGFRQIADGIGAAVRRGKELDSLSRETGRSAEEIALMTEQLHRSDLSMSESAGILEDLQGKWREAAIGATDFGMKLNILGLSTKKLAGMTLPEQFDAIATSINQIRDPVVRAQLAMDLFGAAGKKAVANYQRGDLAEAARLFGKNALDLAGASRQMALVDDAWRRIKRAGEVVFGAMASKVAPVLQAAADKLLTLLPEMQKFGATVGAGLKKGVEVAIGIIKNGKIMEFLKLSFEIAARWLGDILIHVVRFAADLLAEGFIVAASVLTDPHIWNGIIYVFESLGDVLWRGIAAILPKMAGAFNTIVGTIGEMLYQAYTSAEIACDKWWEEKTGLNFGTKKREKALSESNGIGRYMGKEAEDGMKQWVDNIVGITRSASDVRKDVENEFRQVDFSHITNFFKAVPELWEKSAAQLFHDPELLKNLKDMIAKAQIVGNTALKNQKAADARPGEGGKGPRIRTGFGMGGIFDEMRRVGGGLGGVAVNLQKGMYDRLGTIADKSAQQVGLLQDLVKRNQTSGSTIPSYNMPGLQ